MLKRITVAITMSIAAVLAVGVAPAQAAHHRHVAGKVCAQKWTYTHLHSWTAKQCRRQGFLYDVGTYPVTTETTPWTMAPYVQVWGPQGRLWVDTAGFDSVPNIR